MKRALMSVLAICICTSSFAATSLYKGSPVLNALNSAWKAQPPTIQPEQMKDDIAIVYGGGDIAGKATLA